MVFSLCSALCSFCPFDSFVGRARFEPSRRNWRVTAVLLRVYEPLARHRLGASAADRVVENLVESGRSPSEPGDRAPSALSRVYPSVLLQITNFIVFSYFPELVSISRVPTAGLAAIAHIFTGLQHILQAGTYVRCGGFDIRVLALDLGIQQNRSRRGHPGLGVDRPVRRRYSETARPAPRTLPFRIYEPA
jgi:hypothetical protein